MEINKEKIMKEMYWIGDKWSKRKFEHNVKVSFRIMFLEETGSIDLDLLKVITEDYMKNDLSRHETFKKYVKEEVN